MTPAMACAVGAMFCFGIGDFVYKRGAAAGVSAHHMLMVQSWFFLPSCAAIGLVTGMLTFVPGALWGAAAGFFMMAAFYNFMLSLRTGAVSIVAPVFRLSFVITAALGFWLFSETIDIHKVTGIVFALAAVWFLLAAPGGGRGPLGRVVIATVSAGIGNVIYKYGFRAGATPACLLVAQAGVVVTLSTMLVFLKTRTIRPPRITLRYAPVAAIALTIGFALMVEGLRHGDASTIVPIAQMGFVVTAMLGILFLRENLTPRKVVGLTAALAGLASFAFGR